MATFIDLVYSLERIGVADVLLPFFLVFTIVFAVMNKSKILGKKEEVKRYNVLIAFAMGLAVVIPHVLGRYPPGMDVVNIINAALPQVSVFIIAIVMLLLMLGVFGLKWPGGENGENGGSVIVILSILIILYIFLTAAGVLGNGFPWWLYFLADPATQSTIITILVFGVVVWLITRDPKDKNKNDKEGVKLFMPARIDDD